MQTSRIVVALFAIIAVTAAVASTHAAIVVYSNSFEVADGYPSPGGSFTTGGTGMSGQVALYDNGNYFGQATSGSQYLVFNYNNAVGTSGGSYTSPNIATVNGEPYKLSFQYGMWNGPGPQTLTVTVTDTVTLLTPLSTTVSDSTNSTTAFAVMSPYVFNFTGSGNPVSIKILDTTSNVTLSDGLFDNIVVSVPEPASLGFVATVASLFLRRRRINR